MIGCCALAYCTEKDHELPRGMWDSNCTPRLEMTITGAPKCAIHPGRKWAAVHLFRRAIRHPNGRPPADSSVNAGEKVPVVATERCQGFDQIDMNGMKSIHGCGYGLK